jgi:hypothetical protein
MTAVALASFLEQNTGLQNLSTEMNFGERGFMTLAESLPNIKDCSKLTLWRMVFFTDATAVAGD